MTARHSPLFTLRSGQSGLGFYTSGRDAANRGRPIELLYLSIRRDPSTREFHWWCGYSKRSGGGATDPRRLEPLPLIDQNSVVQEWDLLNRWLTGDITLPPLESGNGAAECLKTYLNRQTAWIQLKTVMAAAGRVPSRGVKPEARLP